MHPIIWMVVVVTKLYVVFKVGQKYAANEMVAAAASELEELNVPKGFIDSITGGIRSRLEESEITVDDFIKAMKDVFVDLAGDAKGKMDAALDSAGEMTKGAKENLAGLLQSAVDFLRKPTSEG